MTNATEPLKAAFDALRRTGDYEHALRPLLHAQLFVAGAVLPIYDGPVFYARSSSETGRLCLTASEREDRIAGNPGVVPMRRRGLDLLFEMNSGQDLLILYDDGGEYLRSDQLDWFRECVRQDPTLKEA